MAGAALGRGLRRLHEQGRRRNGSRAQWWRRAQPVGRPHEARVPKEAGAVGRRDGGRDSRRMHRGRDEGQGWVARLRLGGRWRRGQGQATECGRCRAAQPVWFRRRRDGSTEGCRQRRDMGRNGMGVAGVGLAHVFEAGPEGGHGFLAGVSRARVADGPETTAGLTMEEPSGPSSSGGGGMMKEEPSAAHARKGGGGRRGCRRRGWLGGSHGEDDGLRRIGVAMQ